MNFKIFTTALLVTATTAQISAYQRGINEVNIFLGKYFHREVEHNVEFRLFMTIFKCIFTQSSPQFDNNLNCSDNSTVLSEQAV